MHRGSTHTPEVRAKMSAGQRQAYAEGRRRADGENNGRWKGGRCHSAHKRVYRERGSASNYDCVCCGEPAQEWAYDHLDENEQRDADGKYAGRPFSMDPMRYEPMCARCHRIIDMWINASIKRTKERAA